MNIIAVDDEQFALTALKEAIQEAMHGLPGRPGVPHSLSCFEDSETALEYAVTLKKKAQNISIAFLDIEMSGMNGLQLAKQLKDLHGKTIIIFVTGYSQYAVDAFALRAGGYIMKPFTAAEISETIKYFQTADKNTKSKQDKNKQRILRVQTFGNFEIFLDGRPLVFNRKKTKELFAYLVSRKGALCNNNEIIAVLWENKEDTVSLQAQFRKLTADLTDKLNEAGMGDIIVKEWGQLAVVPDKISCDFYDFCAGINVNSYMGEFMSQYSWAEFTNNYLEKLHKRD